MNNIPTQGVDTPPAPVDSADDGPQAVTVRADRRISPEQLTAASHVLESELRKVQARVNALAA